MDSLLDKGNSFLDKHSTTLDVIKLGFEPAVGKIDDLSKVGIVANSSNYTETALSLLKTIPGIGQSVIGSKSGTMINDYAFKNDWFNDTSCSIMFGKTITNARKIKDKKYNLIDKIDSLKTV